MFSSGEKNILMRKAVSVRMFSSGEKNILTRKGECEDVLMRKAVSVRMFSSGEKNIRKMAHFLILPLVCEGTLTLVCEGPRFTPLSRGNSRAFAG